MELEARRYGNEEMKSKYLCQIHNNAHGAFNSTHAHINRYSMLDNKSLDQNTIISFDLKDVTIIFLLHFSMMAERCEIPQLMCVLYMFSSLFTDLQLMNPSIN